MYSIVSMVDPKIQSAMSVVDLSSLINDYLHTIDEQKKQLKEQKQMLKDTFENDQEYHEISEKVRTLNKDKAAVKQRIMKQASVEPISAKIKELQLELRDMDDKLSGYLQEYQRVSGTNVLEGEKGEIMQIVPVYRIVKRSKYNP